MNATSTDWLADLRLRTESPSVAAPEPAPEEIDFLPEEPTKPVAAPTPARPRFALGLVLGLAIMAVGCAAWSGLRAAPSPEVKVVEKTVEKLVIGNDLVVCTRGTGQFTTIKEALAKASAGSRVVLKPGTYREQVVLDKDVALVGGGTRDEVILEGGTGHVVVVEAKRASMENLTVRAVGAGSGNKIHALFVPAAKAGGVSVAGCALSSDTLAAACVEGAESAVSFTRCRLHGSAGGGLLVRKDARPHLSGCDLEENTEAGVIVESGHPTLDRCGASKNKGVGLLSKGGEGAFTGCTFADNTGAAVHVKAGGRPALTRCELKGGTAGLVAEGGVPALHGCTLTGHKFNAVVLIAGADVLLSGCTIKGNGGHGVWALGGHARLVGCTVHGRDKIAAVAVEVAGAVSLTGCTLPGGCDFGVRVMGGRAALEGCTLEGHRRDQVSAEGGADVSLVGCTLADGDENGVYAISGAKVSLTGCTVRGHKRTQLVATSKATLTATPCSTLELASPSGNHVSRQRQ